MSLKHLIVLVFHFRFASEGKMFSVGISGIQKEQQRLWTKMDGCTLEISANGCLWDPNFRIIHNNIYCFYFYFTFFKTRYLLTHHWRRNIYKTFGSQSHKIKQIYKAGCDMLSFDSKMILNSRISSWLV